jgi:membrane-associated protease RseP (regulator of RpoE activity)
MTAPRHLWSGDWRRESAEAAEELARRQGPSEEPAPPSPPEPSGPSPWARALAYARNLSLQAALATALVVLLAAGVGYAAVSLVKGSDGGSVGTTPAWLGAQTVNSLTGNGVLVVGVAPGSPAEQAGLERGDVIIALGNQPIQGAADLQSALAGMDAGQQVEIQYDRGLVLHTTQVTLRAHPANGP